MYTCAERAACVDDARLDDKGVGWDLRQRHFRLHQSPYAQTMFAVANNAVVARPQARRAAAPKRGALLVVAQGKVRDVSEIWHRG